MHFLDLPLLVSWSSPLFNLKTDLAFGAFSLYGPGTLSAQLKIHPCFLGGGSPCYNVQLKQQKAGQGARAQSLVA